MDEYKDEPMGWGGADCGGVASRASPGDYRLRMRVST